MRIVFKHRPLPFHKDAPLAHQASLAAGAQGKFWEMHDVLFENLKALKRPELESYAEGLGLDMRAFNKALDEGTYQAHIDGDIELADAVQSQGTPNHYVNGRRLKGAKPFEDFKEVIDEELKKTDKLLADGVALEDLYGELIGGGKVFEPLEAKVNTFTATHADAIQGDPKSAITVTEFSDYQ